MEEGSQDRIQRLELTVQALEERLSRVERAGAKAAPLTPQAPAAKPQASTKASPAPSATVSFGLSAALGIVAVVCFILAGAYLVRFAIDSGLLTPERQILLAILFGGALIATGLRLSQRDTDYAAYLPASGVVVLFLSFFGASSLYGLVEPVLAVVLTAGVAALAVVLFQHYRTSVYAVLACLGAYFVPYLLHSEDIGFVTSYYIPCSVAFTVMAIQLRYRPFLLLSAYLALGLTHHLSIRAGDPAMAASLLALHFLLFLLGVAAYSVRNKEPLTEGEALAFTPLLLFFYWMEHGLLSQLIPFWVDWLALAFVAFLNAFHVFVARKMTKAGEHGGLMVHGFSILVVFHAFYLNLVPDSFKPILFLFVTMALAFGKPPQLLASPLLQRLFEIGLFLVLLGNYVSVLFSLAKPDPALHWALYGALYTFSLLILSFRVMRAEGGFSFLKDGLTAVLVAGHLQAVFTLYSLAKGYGSLAVSGAWAIYALAILALGFRERSQVIARSSLAVLMVAAGKAFLYDVQSANPGVRILCLLLTGCLLYGTGLLFRRIATWQSP